MSGTHLALKTSLKKREHSGFKNRNKNEFSTGKMWPFPCLRYSIPRAAAGLPSEWAGWNQGHRWGSWRQRELPAAVGVWSWHVSCSWEKYGIAFPSPFNPSWTTLVLCTLNSWGLSGCKENLPNTPVVFSEHEDIMEINFLACFQHQTWSLYLRQVYTCITYMHICMLWFTWQCLS